MTDNIELIKSTERLYLCDREAKLNIEVDFIKLIESNRGKNSNSQGLIKAIGKFCAKKIIYDLTAGLGKDSMIIALQGYKINMFEKHKLLYQMLRYAIDALAQTKYYELAHRMKLHNLDSKEFCKNLTYDKNNIFYLDPMFPERNKNAKVKKDLQLLQKICPCEENIEDFINLLKGKGKIIVKRPKLAPEIKIKPHHVIKGSKIDFYVY